MEITKRYRDRITKDDVKELVRELHYTTMSGIAIMEGPMPMKGVVELAGKYGIRIKQVSFIQARLQEPENLHSYPILKNPTTHIDKTFHF